MIVAANAWTEHRDSSSFFLSGSLENALFFYPVSFKIQLISLRPQTQQNSLLSCLKGTSYFCKQNNRNLQRFQSFYLSPRLLFIIIFPRAQAHRQSTVKAGLING